LRCSLCIHDRSATLACEDIQIVYNELLDVVKFYIEHCIPVKTVCIGRRDPEFITPYIRSLLNKRNKLRKQGKYELADNLSKKINGAIANNLSNQLSKLVDAPVHTMWDALHAQNKAQKENSRTSHLLNDVEQVNAFFASFSYDPLYKVENVSVYRHSSNVDDYQPLYAYEIEPLLRRVTKTAPGRDNIPYWVFGSCSFELADVVAHIYNSTLRTGVVPTQWLTAVITPIPKIPNPGTLSDFRPISVTPILSRIMVLVVLRWIRPAIISDLISDQFAFRPTGSTTCALVYFMHHVTRMLETNSYVRCLLVDFTKAFDVVDHVVLVEKISKLKLPECVLKWLISFLVGRNHTTKTAGVESRSLPINLSSVQGSGVGPTLYIILESDLKPVSLMNIVFKYADDTNLLVPEHTDVQL
jgi:Reverse transcriptase (RNA-dependent DNA polymerase)